MEYSKFLSAAGELLTDLDIDFALKYFNKEHYFEFLDKYMEKNSEIFDKINELMTEDDESKIKEFASAFASDCQKFISKKFFLRRTRLTVDFSYALTCYVLPAVLSLNHKNSLKTAEIIAKEWGVCFPNMSNIKPATKEELLTGFKKRIFGIPLE